MQRNINILKHQPGPQAGLEGNKKDCNHALPIAVNLKNTFFWGVGKTAYGAQSFFLDLLSGIEPGLALCKAIASPTVLLIWPNHFNYSCSPVLQIFHPLTLSLYCLGGFASSILPLTENPPGWQKWNIRKGACLAYGQTGFNPLHYIRSR